MFYLSEKEFRRKMKEQKLKNESAIRKQELQKEKDKYKTHKKISTSKLVLWTIIILVIQIVFFVEYCMVKYGDFSAAYALIGIPATLIPVVWGYYSKSKAENTVGGITYDMAMNNYMNNYFENSPEETTNELE